MSVWFIFFAIFITIYFLLKNLDDFFEEVKQKKSIYKEYFDSFLMDQQKKQYKAVLEDGEFSDEVILIK